MKKKIVLFIGLLLFSIAIIHAQTVRVAVIGDFGVGIWSGPAQDEAAVAALVDSWHANSPLDAVTTVGDNNYPEGLEEDIDENIGQFYHQYIYPYQGTYTHNDGSPGGNINQQNLFFPTIGNHDYGQVSCSSAGDASPYFNYFQDPAIDDYYDVEFGNTHFFMYDSDCHQQDGIDVNSVQAQWLQTALANSTKKWKIVLLHHPPYSSGNHGDHPDVQLPFAAWGADAVLAGHDHLYERFDIGGTPYFVNGTGGNSLTPFGNHDPSISMERYNEKHGAMLLTFTSTEATFQFINRDNELIDEITLGGSSCDNAGGDSDGDNVCDDDDCLPFDPNFPTTPGMACDDGDSGTINDVIQADGCTCEGITIGGPGTCEGISVTTSGNNVIVSNLFGTDQIVKIHDENWNLITKCNSFSGDNCTPSYTYNGSSNTTYVVSVQIFGSTECNDNYTVTTGSGCIDTDGDGTCDGQDCEPNNPNLPTTPGSSCDDGDSNTNNDVIQSDGCTCAGIPIGGGGTCADISVTTSGSDVIVSNLFGDDQIVKIHDENWNQITKCNSFNGDNCTPTYTFNGNSNTTYVVSVQIFGSTSCNDNYTVTTGSGCTDTDGDGICDGQDCEPNNPNLPTTPGSSCDDGDSNTNNDVILADGCTCAGTPIGGGGTCADISVTTSGSNIIASNLFGDNQIVKIYDQNWNEINKCNSFNGDNCLPSYTYNGNFSTTYQVSVQIFGSTSCNENYTVTTGSNLVSNHKVEAQTQKGDLTKTQSIKASQFKIYPNPAKNTLNVILDDFQDKEGFIEIHNSLGQKVINRSYPSFPAANINFNIENLEAGIYFISVVANNDQRVIKRFIVAK